MKERGIPSYYSTADNAISFVDISRQFNASKYGEILKNNVRFWTFKPDDTPNSQWEKLLGADVNNLNHLQVSLGLTKSFLHHCDTTNSSWQAVPQEATFSHQEQSILQLTAITHDWGEAIIGDISMPEKTKLDEEREMVAFRGVVSDVLGGKDKNFCEDFSDKVIDVLTNTSSKLGRAFNAIEHVGYTRTALRAWERAQKSEGDIQQNLKHLTYDVIFRSIPKLADYATVYPPLDSYLTYHQDNIREIFEETDEASLYVASERFAESKEIWKIRETSNGSEFL